MALPFLPGNSFSSSLGKTKYHKSHHFDNCNDVSMLVGHEKPGIGGEPLLGQKLRTKNSVFPSGEGTNVPAWVAFDRQVLCFDAFFQEAVHEKREEQFRIRNCKIYFYLEDDSIQVIEPRIKNSGVPQGTLIRRHRVPKPPPHDDVFYTVEDFNIGVELNLYSKVFKISGCDEFTQNFLRKLGVRVNGPNDTPTDPYVQHRKAMDESMQPLRPYEKHDTLKQFLDHDRHVLRFYCYWDDSDNMFGDPREMILHYFLADDTIEIRECIPPNSGRDAVPVFVRRGKLPKDVDSMKQPGTVTDRTVLNVFGPTGHGGRYILDSLKTGAVHTEFYTDTDLSIGAVLNVWGRKFLLTDCDQFTQEYYKTKYGIEEFSPISYKQTPSRGIRKTFPPFNGFGSEEDSLCSCMGLMPKPPKRDFIKFMEKDRHGLDSNVLRFLGRMDTSKPIDMDRRFIISYFLSDDSVLVFEPPVRNSESAQQTEGESAPQTEGGIIGGKFLERGRVKKPGQEPYSTEISCYYTAQDLFVGASVEFNKFKFILIDADEYAFRYMEEHPSEFPIANVKAICQKVSSKIGQNKEDIRAFFARNDASGNGIVSYEQFSGLLRQIDSSLTEHEIMTVARYYSEQRAEDAMDHVKLVAIIQEQLRKRNFEGFGTLVQSFLHADREKSGFLDAETIRTVFHAHHVPLPDDLLRAAIASAPANESGLILYEEFVKQMNWRDFPVPPMQFQPVSEEADWAGTAAKNAVNAVNYQAMLSDVFGSS